MNILTLLYFHRKEAFAEKKIPSTDRLYLVMFSIAARKCQADLAYGTINVMVGPFLRLYFLPPSCNFTLMVHVERTCGPALYHRL